MTVTGTVPAPPVQPAAVAVTEYVPEAAVVALTMEGLCTEEVKPFGPVQLYVAPTMPEAERLSVSPAQIGELQDAAGAGGVVFTVTFTVPAALVHPLTVTVTEYVPAAAALTPLMTGFCSDEEKPFGPVQLYVAPGTAVLNRLSAAPVQTGLLLETPGAEGIGLTITLVVPGGPVQLPTDAVTEYVPASAAVAAAMTGFCAVEVNPFGPVHAYVAPVIVPAVRLIGEPIHTGLLLPVAGAGGVVTEATVTVAVAGGQEVAWS